MKSFIHLVFIALVSLFTACSSDKQDSVEYAEMHFRATIPNSDFKSTGTGSVVNMLYVEAISNTNDRVRFEFPVTSGTVNAKISLAKGQTYDLIFWAQRQENNLYNITDLRAITMNLPTTAANVTGMEQYDAFYATVRNVAVGNQSVTDVEMQRPLAQLNVASTNEATKTIIEFASIPTTFKPLNTEAPFEYTSVAITFDRDNSTFELEGTTYNHLAMMYIFATPTGNKISFDATITKSETESNTITIQEIDIKANNRTNILGAL